MSTRGEIRIEVIDLLKNPQLAKGTDYCHTDAGKETS